MSAHQEIFYQKNWNGRTIIFNANSENLESYPEKGIKAKILSATAKHD